MSYHVKKAPKDNTINNKTQLSLSLLLPLCCARLPLESHAIYFNSSSRILMIHNIELYSYEREFGSVRVESSQTRYLNGAASIIISKLVPSEKS